MAGLVVRMVPGPLRERPGGGRIRCAAVRIALVGAVTFVPAGCAPQAEPPVKVIVVPLRPPASPYAYPTPAEDAKALPVTAEKLYMTYTRYTSTGGNADQRYRNRLLLVTGTVEGITRGVPGRVYLELHGGDSDGMTYAEPAPEALASFLELGAKAGATVRLLCRGDSVAVGSPLLRQCLVR